MQLPNNTFEIVKTQYFRGVVTPIIQAQTIRMPDGRDIQMRPGDNFIQYDQGFYEIIRGDIDLNNGIYSKYIEGKIVKEEENKNENIIIPISLHNFTKNKNVEKIEEEGVDSKINE
jgi:hypothetical protein